MQKLTPCGSELRCTTSAVAIIFFEGVESTASSRTFCEEREGLTDEWTHLWKPRFTGWTVEVEPDKQAKIPVQPNISARADDLNLAWHSSADTMCRMCVLGFLTRAIVIFQQTYNLSLPRAPPEVNCLDLAGRYRKHRRVLVANKCARSALAVRSWDLSPVFCVLPPLRYVARARWRSSHGLAVIIH